MTRRHFFRCEDCLTIAVTETPLAAVHDQRGNVQYALCNACGGEVEYMGRVHGASLVRTEYQCACDGRCTGATGPSCDCQCGGENHGTGRVVEVVTSAQSLPRLMTPPESLEKATAYRSLLQAVRTAWDQRYRYVTQRKRAGEFLDGNEYQRFTEGVYTWKSVAKARQLRTHAGRNKRLTAILHELTGSRATVCA